MSKITPQDYIEAGESLIQAGFLAIKKSLADGGSVSDVAKLYIIPETYVEIVKTTNDYQQYKTIVTLEHQRAEAEAELQVQQEKEAQRQSNLYSPTPKPKIQGYHYAIALVILIGLGYLAYRFIDLIMSWIIGGF